MNLYTDESEDLNGMRRHETAQGFELTRLGVASLIGSLAVPVAAPIADSLTKTVQEPEDGKPNRCPWTATKPK